MAEDPLSTTAGTRCSRRPAIPTRPALRSRWRACRPRADARVNEIIREHMIARAFNWTTSPIRRGLGEKVFGEPDVERLWEAVAFCTRLDEADPVAAWREHMAKLETRAAELNERKFDALRYRGPGTDFTIGLLPSARWMSALFRTAAGREYVPNMPTEEIFTTPDSRRAEGTITSTRPLALSGDVIEGLQLTVKDGLIVEVRRSTAPRWSARSSRATRARAVRRSRARRRRLARRPDRNHLFRHAVRRERDLPHRLRLRDPGELRRRPARR